MKKQERYWLYRAANDTPELHDLPEGTFAGTEEQFNSFSPGMRREIYRSAMKKIQKTLDDSI